MKKILSVLLLVALLTGCYSKEDVWDNFINSDFDADVIYSFPDSSFSWVAMKGDKVYFIQAYRDTGNIDVYELQTLDMVKKSNKLRLKR